MPAPMWYNPTVDLLTTSVAAVESEDDEPYTLVGLVGEADVTNSDALRDVLDAEVAKEPRTLIIDLSGLRFMDSSALHVILRANRAMDRLGGVLALAGPREPVAKMLRLTAADQLVPVYGSVDQASAG
jgi:anti-sigma B factor antagonist